MTVGRTNKGNSLAEFRFFSIFFCFCFASGKFAKLQPLRTAHVCMRDTEQSCVNQASGNNTAFAYCWVALLLQNSTVYSTEGAHIHFANVRSSFQSWLFLKTINDNMKDEIKLMLSLFTRVVNEI